MSFTPRGGCQRRDLTRSGGGSSSGGGSDLAQRFDPVDARGVRDTRGSRDRGAHEGRGGTDEDRPQDADVLPAREEEPSRHADDDAGPDDGAGLGRLLLRLYVVIGGRLGSERVPGTETYSGAVPRWHAALEAAEHLLLAVASTAEVLLRAAALADRPKGFFRAPCRGCDRFTGGSAEPEKERECPCPGGSPGRTARQRPCGGSPQPTGPWTAWRPARRLVPAARAEGVRLRRRGNGSDVDPSGIGIYYLFTMGLGTLAPAVSSDRCREGVSDPSWVSLPVRTVPPPARTI